MAEPGSFPPWLNPREYFRDRQRHPRKRLGQNFLNQPQTARRIVEAAAIEAADTVVEVGPGLGALTRYLLQRGSRLVLVEVDPDLARYLSERPDLAGGRVSILCRDVLSLSFESIKDEDGGRLIVVGNLPYNISSPLLFLLLESRCWVDRCVFMVQREVGERLAAAPGSRQYGVLSVLLQACAHVRLLFRIGPNQFFPRPKVDSVVVKIDFDRPPLAALPSFHVLRRVVNAAFSKRRKKLKNSLKQLFPERAHWLEELLRELDLDPGRRPETLTPEEYVRLTRRLLEGADQ